MPTLLGLSGRQCRRASRGWTIAAYLRGGKDPSDGPPYQLRRPFGQWTRAIGGQEYRGIRTARHTYVRDLRALALFDNEADPYQMQNLVGRPEHADLQARLDAMLLRKLRVDRRRVPAGRGLHQEMGLPRRRHRHGPLYAVIGVRV